MVRRLEWEPPARSRYTGSRFGDLIRNKDSALRASRKPRLDPYALTGELEKLAPHDRFRACHDLLGSDDPREVELAFKMLPSQQAIKGVSARLLDGQEVSWEGLRLFAQAPGLTREQIMEVMPRPSRTATKEDIFAAVTDTLRRGDWEIRGVDGLRFNSRQTRQELADRFAELGPDGGHMIVVSPHEVGFRQVQLRQFVDLLVGRLVRDRMVKAEELNDLMEQEAGKLIVARHPEATVDQLKQLVCERFDFYYQAAYLNAVGRNLQNEIIMPSANKWVQARLIEDPQVETERLHALEKLWAEPLFRKLEEKYSQLSNSEKEDLLLLLSELRTWLYPNLSILIKICRDHGLEVETNTMYFKLAKRLYPDMEAGDQVAELLNYLQQEYCEAHLAF